MNAKLSENQRIVAGELLAIDGQESEARRKRQRQYEALESGELDMEFLAPRIRKWKGQLDELRAQS